MTLQKQIYSACELFEQTKINFSNFCDMLGEVLDLANPLEAKRIGELTRELELAIVTNDQTGVRSILGQFQTEFNAKR